MNNRIYYTDNYKNNMIGKKINRLTILGFEKRFKKDGYYDVICKCKCDCGNTKYIIATNLFHNRVYSCGCYRKEKVNEALSKHKESNTRLYTIWQHIKMRTKENTKYKNYEKLGIKMCDEWKSDYIIFRDWALENGYRDDLSIDRIDTYGNYEPSNCRFADNKTQINNRTVTIYLTDDNGVRKCLSEWCEFYGVTYKNASTRLERGWEFKDIFRKEIGKSRNGRKSRRVVKGIE